MNFRFQMMHSRVWLLLEGKRIEEISFKQKKKKQVGKGKTGDSPLKRKMYVNNG